MDHIFDMQGSTILENGQYKGNKAAGIIMSVDFGLSLSMGLDYGTAPYAIMSLIL